MNNKEEIDWNSYRRYLYDVWEDQPSLQSLIDSEIAPSELSSESLEVPFGLTIQIGAKYSPKDNKLHLTSPTTSNKGEPTTTVTLSTVNRQGDENVEKKSTQRSRVKGNDYEYAAISSECSCYQCKKRMYTPTALPANTVQECLRQAPDASRETKYYAPTSQNPVYKSSQPNPVSICRHYNSNKSRPMFYSESQFKDHAPTDPNRNNAKNPIPEIVMETHCEECSAKGQVLNSPSENSSKFSAKEATKDKRVQMCINNCSEEINKLKKELNDSKKHIRMLSVEMEEQACQIHHLIEERRNTPPKKSTSRKPDPNFGLSFLPPFLPPNRTQPTCNYDALHTEKLDSGIVGVPLHAGLINPTKESWTYQDLRSAMGRLKHDPQLASLNDQISALQKKEEKRRKEIEEDLERERNYIKNLEDNIQNLRSSRVIMDPRVYREVADNYIASRKQPVRRTHTCLPYIGKSDLVCDESARDSLTVNYPNSNSSTSCPSSPRNSNIKQDTSRSQRFSLDDTSLPTDLQEHLPHIASSSNHDLFTPWSLKSDASTMDPQEYMRFLESLNKPNPSSPS